MHKNVPVSAGPYLVQAEPLFRKNVGPQPRHTKSFPLFRNHYFNIAGLLPCCKKNEKKLSFCGTSFLWGNMLNMPKSAAGHVVQ